MISSPSYTERIDPPWSAKMKERYRENIEKMRKRLELYNIILERQYKWNKPPNSTTKQRASWFLITQTHKFLSRFYLRPSLLFLPLH